MIDLTYINTTLSAHRIKLHELESRVRAYQRISEKVDELGNHIIDRYVGSPDASVIANICDELVQISGDVAHSALNAHMKKVESEIKELAKGLGIDLKDK
jgi:hypothetical protein